MTKSTRNVVLAIVGVVVLGCLGTGALVVGVGTFAASQLGGSGEWSEDAVPERELPRMFGVRLPVKPLYYRSRELGFQDGLWEVVVQLPPGSVEAFLGANKLERGAAPLPGVPAPETYMNTGVDELIHSVDPATPALSPTPVTLPDARQPDGGLRNLIRRAVLLEAPGVTWLYLEAFET